MNSLSGNGSAKLGTVATVVSAANSTALECSKEIEAAMQISLRNALGMVTNKTTDGPMDDLAIMRVKYLYFPLYTVSLLQLWIACLMIFNWDYVYSLWLHW